MEPSPINISEFKPIFYLIHERRISFPEREIWVNIRIPSGFEVDIDKVKNIFKEDVIIHWERNERGQFTYLKGTIGNKDISEYLIRELSCTSYYKSTGFDPDRATQPSIMK